MRYSFPFLVFASVLFRVGDVRAQYVTIPDSNFVAFLQWSYPSCMNGNQLDTTCNEIINENVVQCNNMGISDLTGIEYFVGLQGLYCSYNQLTILPSLTNNITYLDCSHNQLTSFTNLPYQLNYLYCGNNQLESLPTLPPWLSNLYCDSNLLTSLPDLGYNMLRLSCSHNLLTNLPQLPEYMSDLSCGDNQLTSLPTLPENLYLFKVDNNPQLMCMPLLHMFYGPDSNFNVSNTGITCLPNFIQHFEYIAGIDTMLICDMFSVNGCDVAWNIKGNLYRDDNSNCLIDSEPPVQNIKLLLLQSSNILQQVYSNGGGNYSFDTDINSYQVNIDTTDLPFYVSCPINNFYSINLTGTDSLYYDADFALQCNSGYDIAAQSIVAENTFFPNNNATVYVQAGDLVQYYGTTCNTSGLSGTVEATFTGPATVSSVSGNGLVSGNTITWNVSDFSQVNFFDDFQITFLTDSSAQEGEQVCVTVTVEASSGTDNNPSNNTLTNCFEVVNSYDPNFKEVYPTTPEPSTWYTYTVHFQNTGTAAAQHILIKDTLDSNLDWSSFQLLAYSHENLTQVKDNIVLFNFPNINLPDSNSNEPESHGYIQYKIKTSSNVNPATTIIHNTASIYFDFNSPIMTNDAIISPATGIKSISQINFTLTPNPANDNITITSPQSLQNDLVVITDITGRTILQKRLGSHQTQINVSELSSGTYFVQLLRNDKTVGVKKLVVMR